MDVIPAIDLLHGKAVRLRRGRYDDATFYEHDPAQLAAQWKGQVPRLHVVDLEGARAGRAVQTELVRRVVAAFGGGVQVGGGVRTLEAAQSYLELGVERVVLGTAAVKDQALVRALALANPGRVIIALDANDGWVATDGWEQTSDRRVADLVHELEALPLAGVLYTDIERDGTEVGPNVRATAELALATHLEVIASGGVGTLGHLTELARAGGPIRAAIVGRALHEGRFSLAEAVLAAG
ncbi:MAG: 1-(5-phosphoribosyl)-5-[(5-phosphoribosylamino)methylideneamino]imidazole-4-carboxamide isomerase [Myxococcales bacterium]|nr:1-(5-phosphoribosyl)-5-[(5-phosphoribosylamino)methylideneamino]imidazole-4-carboxamide isomerase [Myxococcales bacterium]